jgi:O-methyltransferase
MSVPVPETVTFTFSTMLSKVKCHNLWKAATKVRNLNGEFWDVGCNAGGSSAVMKLAAPERPIWMFDSFEGLPESTSEDQNNHPGRFAAKFEEVMWMLGPVYQGWVPETFKGLEDTKLALVHVDLDLYQSTKDALSFIGPRVIPGGLIVVDDYGSEGWNGVSKAVDEFVTEEFIVSKDVPEQITLERKIE